MKESILQCHVADCDKPSKCHGYCAKHYTRFYRHGDDIENVMEWVQQGADFGENQKNLSKRLWGAKEGKCES